MYSSPQTKEIPGGSRTISRRTGHWKGQDRVVAISGNYLTAVISDFSVDSNLVLTVGKLSSNRLA